MNSSLFKNVDVKIFIIGKEKKQLLPFLDDLIIKISLKN